MKKKQKNINLIINVFKYLFLNLDTLQYVFSSHLFYRYLYMYILDMFLCMLWNKCVCILYDTVYIYYTVLLSQCVFIYIFYTHTYTHKSKKYIKNY